MDEFLGAIFGIFIFLALLVYLLRFIYSVIMFMCGNFIIAFDYFFGAWSIFPPAFSWASMGFLFGSLLYFAFMEAQKLNRPAVKGRILTACILIIFVSLI